MKRSWGRSIRNRGRSNNLAFAVGAWGPVHSSGTAVSTSASDTEKVLGPDSPDVWAQLYNLAALLWKEGRFTDARVVGERAGRIEVSNLSGGSCPLMNPNRDPSWNRRLLLAF